jgi:gluconate 2-dehydrogenase gamma chain
MKAITRREALKLFGAAPAAAAMVWTPAEVEAAHARAEQSRQSAARRSVRFEPKFFTAHEYATVVVLVDLIIPRDERSGSATEAGVPEFMDFMMVDEPRRQTAMRGGLALIDRLCEQRFDKRFLDCSEADRKRLLDEIAFPASAPPPLAHAVAFFSSFRDLTAGGFWTTKMGIADLQYQGNTFAPDWDGCPAEALKHLDVGYTK